MMKHMAERTGRGGSMSKVLIRFKVMSIRILMH